MVEDLQIGGIEKVIASIVIGLDRTKFLPEVWCLAKGGAIAVDLAQNDIPIRILGMMNYHNPLAILKLARLLREVPPEILHTHGYFAGTFGRLAAFFASVPVTITHVHSTYTGYLRRHLWMEKFLSFFTDQIICISEAVRNFVVETEGVQKGKTCVIHNGVDLSFAVSTGRDRRAVRSLLKIQEDEVVLACVASLTPVKGHAVLLDAFHKALEDGLKGKLLLIGSGPLKQELEKQAETLGISSRVIFAGERWDVADLLHGSQIVVLSSVEREGLGISLIEAMVAGLPLIGSKLGGIPEVIEDRVNGLLVTPGSSVELASAMITLGLDSALRKQMGEMGKKRYQESFTLPEMLRKIETLYDNLLQRRAHAS
jgi:glycosyltransferase involved in cell wall biosynthesis